MNPHGFCPLDPKSSASANSATPAYGIKISGMGALSSVSGWNVWDAIVGGDNG